jgi:hypothetical protein
MNELERMIAAIEVPGPSDQLDERVRATLAARRAQEPSRRMRDMLAMLGASACIGLIGFVLGRQSVAVPPVVGQPTSTLSVSDEPALQPATQPQIVRVPLRDDQLASFFVQPAAREGMLGRGPVRFDVTTSP